ncbi:MAG TPA: hypothetical protein VKK31_07780 [Thermoanaerobaculia bacterium]|nr:hypothetical protein [Thermoanaerobaculia bacterium]
MRKIKFMALAMGLTVTAMMQARNGAADLTCEERCREEYARCVVFCSKTPCFVPCEYGYNICLNNCGSES